MKKEEKVDIHCMKYPICKFCPKDSICNKGEEQYKKVKIKKRGDTIERKAKIIRN